MKVVLLFLDESSNTCVSPHLSSCTGILVPVEKYDNLRLGFYRAINKEIQPTPNVIDKPIELHFSNFLPGTTDKRKFEVWTTLVRLVLNLEIQVVRTSLFVTDKLRKESINDPNLFRDCFDLLLYNLSPLTNDYFIVPIFDAGFSKSFQPTVDYYSGSNKTTEIMRSAGLNLGLKLCNWSNQMEVLYADSKYSAPIQLVDNLGGLRKIVDTKTVSPDYKLSKFKKELFHIGSELNSAMVIDKIISLEYNGVVEGPDKFAIKKECCH